MSGKLTAFQTRRVWRCLEKMRGNEPSNPMDVKARVEAAYENKEAAGKLAGAFDSAIVEDGATMVNEQIGEAEDALHLERIESTRG